MSRLAPAMGIGKYGPRSTPLRRCTCGEFRSRDAWFQLQPAAMSLGCRVKQPVHVIWGGAGVAAAGATAAAGWLREQLA